jgi:hypothetical protein
MKAIQVISVQPPRLEFHGNPLKYKQVFIQHSHKIDRAKWCRNYCCFVNTYINIHQYKIRDRTPQTVCYRESELN